MHYNGDALARECIGIACVGPPMSGLDFAVDPPEDTPAGHALARRTEAALRRVFEENNLDQLDFETELDAAILGDAAFKVAWDPVAERVRVSAPDVQGLFLWWRGDDPARVWRVASRYQLSAPEARALFGVAAAGKTGVLGSREGSVTVVEEWTDSLFALWVDGRLHEQRPNPYGVIPFVNPGLSAVTPNLGRAPKVAKETRQFSLEKRIRR